MYVYILTDTNPNIYTVGYYSPNGKWNPESDYTLKSEAKEQVAYLNGRYDKRQDNKNDLGKIFVCLSDFKQKRIDMVASLLLRFHFARIKSDAKKIIVQTPFDIDLESAYFVAAHSYSLNESAITTHKLYNLAILGRLVILGAKKVHPEMEYMCKIYTISDFK